nr:uncharacterized protein LOC107448244 [Parasteatoda tepidariorum]
MKTMSKEKEFPKLSLDKENNNVCIIPVSFGDTFKEPEKKDIPNIDIQPGLFFPEFYEKGLDNPAYYDPLEARKVARADTKKQKFISRCIPGDSNGAKLTKVPGLNIWRLDFRKPSSSNQSIQAPWYRLTTILAMVAILALVVCGVAVIVHAVKGGLIFGFPWFPFENESDIIGINRVATHFRIMNRKFEIELTEKTSEQHLQLVAELKHSLDVLFMDSPLVNLYNTSNDFQFSNGSVIVQCTVHLKRPLPDGAQRVGFAFVRALEEGKGILPPGMFYIDVHTVRFAAMKMETSENASENLSESGEWSEWSSCMRNGTCDSTRIRVRKRRCQGSLKDVCSGHHEVVETRPCLCPLPVSIATLTTSSLLLPGEWSQWSSWSSCSTPEDMCDPQQIQRRTRECKGLGLRGLPTIVCSKKTGESAIQMRHCLCSEEKEMSDLESSKELIDGTTLHVFENDYMHWFIPIKSE